jgi:ectoine hydroxylase-related dioxygenase (phytanoyl-CoA dioxygenase family)
MARLLSRSPESLELEDVLARFDRDGYATLGRVASDEALEAMRARTDDLMLGRVQYPGLFFQLDTESGRYEDLRYGQGWEGPSLNYRKIEKVEKDPLFSAWIDNPLFERIARARVGDEVAIYRAVIMSKKAEGGSFLPWHQDGGKFWGLDRDPQLQIWTALDDAPEEAGCVEVIPGTHRAGLVTPLGGVVPENFVAARSVEPSPVCVQARAGEVILIHNHVWHRSGVNRTTSPRRALSICYMPASTRCLRTRRAPREFHRAFVTPPGTR